MGAQSRVRDWGRPDICDGVPDCTCHDPSRPNRQYPTAQECQKGELCWPLWPGHLKLRSTRGLWAGSNTAVRSMGHAAISGVKRGLTGADGSRLDSRYGLFGARETHDAASLGELRHRAPRGFRMFGH